MAEYPLLAKPGQMAHLPQEWIDDGQVRPEKLVLVEIAEQLQRALARVNDGLGESGLGNHKRFKLSPVGAASRGGQKDLHSGTGIASLPARPGHWRTGAVTSFTAD